MLKREATNSDTRFRETAHGSTYIRKYVKYVDHMSRINRQADNKILFSCDGTVVRQAFKMTPKEKYASRLNQKNSLARELQRVVLSNAGLRQGSGDS